MVPEYAEYRRRLAEHGAVVHRLQSQCVSIVYSKEGIDNGLLDNPLAQVRPKGRGCQLDCASQTTMTTS